MLEALEARELMLSESLVEKIAIFYYLTYLDESKALSATTRTLKQLSHRQIDKLKTPLNLQTAVICSIEESEKKRRNLSKPSSLSFSAGSIVAPEATDWSPWFEFRKLADEREFRTVVYSQIMKFSDQAISDGMQLSIGTVRYRLGRGLKTLGHILKPEKKSHHV